MYKIFYNKKIWCKTGWLIEKKKFKTASKEALYILRILLFTSNLKH